MQMRVELADGDPCGCGSMLAYSDCGKLQKIRFDKDHRGNISQANPDALHLLSHTDEHGAVGIYRKNDPYRAIVFVMLVSLLMLEETARCSFVYKMRASDLVRCKRRIATKLIGFLSHANGFSKDFVDFVPLVRGIDRAHRNAF
jgi:hypothetical protein